MDTSFIARIEALESEVRRWKLITLIVVGGLIVILEMAAASAQPGQRESGMPSDPGFALRVPAADVAAHNFSLVGRDGKTYARLTARQGTPLLEFYDAQGQIIWSAPPKHGLVPVEK